MYNKNTGLVLLASSLLFFVALSFATLDCTGLVDRSLDGSCNNLLSPSLGQSGEFYRRGDEGAEYNADNTPVTNRPAERVISNRICRDNPSLLDPIRHSILATQFGQFVNHDLNNNAFQNPQSLTYPSHLVSLN